MLNRFIQLAVLILISYPYMIHTHIQLLQDEDKSFLQLSLSKGDFEEEYYVIENPFASKYTKHKTLGKGNFASVVLATRNFDQKKFAVKIIECNPLDMKQIKNEIDIVLQLDNPNIAKVYEVYAFTGRVYVVMELLSGGDISDLIKKEMRLTEEVTKHIIYNLTAAVAYINEKNIAHRDIKPANVMVTKVNEKEYSVKLIDFGLGRQLQSTNDLMTTILGTPEFMEPAIFNEKYTIKCDTWAIAATAYNMMVGENYMYKSNTLYALIKNGKPKYPFSQDLKAFIIKNLSPDFKERQIAKDAVNDIWFNSVKASLKLKADANQKDKQQILTNIITYPEKLDKLKKFIQTLLIEYIPKEIAVILKDMFLYINSQSSIGFISAEELSSFSGNKESKLIFEKTIKNISFANENKLSFTEFLYSSTDMKSLLTIENLKMLFILFDDNKDKFIDGIEFYNIIRRQQRFKIPKAELEFILESYYIKKMNESQFISFFSKFS